MQMTATGAKNRFSHRCAKGRSAPMFDAKGGLLKFVMRNLSLIHIYQDMK